MVFAMVKHNLNDFMHDYAVYTCSNRALVLLFRMFFFLSFMIVLMLGDLYQEGLKILLINFLFLASFCFFKVGIDIKPANGPGILFLLGGIASVFWIAPL